MKQRSNGKQIVQYLLGDLPEEEQQQLDEQFFVNDDYFERLMATEDELIDDYLRGRLSAHERERFERNFLTSPFLRERVTLAKALIDYIDGKVRVGAAMPSSIQHLGFGKHRSSAGEAVSVKDEDNAAEAYRYLKQGLRGYQASLCVIAAGRLVILAFLWVFMYRLTFTSDFHSYRIFYILSTLIVLYVLLESLNLSRAASEAHLVLIETGSETDRSLV